MARSLATRVLMALLATALPALSPSASQSETAEEAVARAEQLWRSGEQVAAYRRIIRECPGLGTADEALAGLYHTIYLALEKPERWRAELRHMTDLLLEALPRQTDPKSRCNVLWALTRAADFAGDTRAATAYCREIIQLAPRKWEGDFLSVTQRDARRCLEGLDSPAKLTVIADRTLHYVTTAKDLTPEVEVDRKLVCALYVIAYTPPSRPFFSSIAMVSPRPLEKTEPPTFTARLPDGRERAVWEGRHAGKGVLTSQCEKVKLIWVGKTHVDHVKVWRDAEIIAPGRQRVSVVVKTYLPCAVSVDTAGGAAIDPETVELPPNPPAESFCARYITWSREPDRPRARGASLNCSRGRLFTFEMTLPEGVKRVLPQAGWRRHQVLQSAGGAGAGGLGWSPDRLQH